MKDWELAMHKTLKAILGGAAGVVLMAASGYAADMVEPVLAPTPAAAGFNWSGFYVGIGGGFGAVSYGGSPVGFGGFGGGGGFGEVTAGYDYMLTNRILLGGFIDANLGNIGAEARIGPFTLLELENRYGFDAGLRLGYVLNGSTIGYALGGYTWRQVNASSALIGGSEHENMDGYMLGLGMETAISRNWTIKTEYRYSRYDLDAGGGDEINPITHTFHIAANYRFGAGNGTAAAIASPVYDWSGFYVGASVGAGQAVNDTSLGIPVLFGLNGLSGDGIFGELNAGYDHDFGGFVAGVMVDGSYSGIKSDFVLGGPDTDLTGDYGFDILGRLGMKVNPSTLAYVLGGYSWAHFKLNAGGGGDFDWSSSGYSVGGGLETAVASHTTLGIEYRYSQFGDEDIGPGGALSVEPSLHTVRVGLKYKFN
jgi:outer membrane immunogenic protein